MEDLGIAGRRLALVDARGSPGEDDALEPVLLQRFRSDVGGEDFAVDAGFPGATRDQLSVLGTEIENGNVVVVRHFRGPSEAFDSCARESVTVYRWAARPPPSEKSDND